MRHEKSFKQLLKEIKYIPVIPIVNVLFLLCVLIYWIYDDIKNKKQGRLGYSIGFIIIIFSMILLFKTHQYYWIFSVPVYCGIWQVIIAKRKLEERN
jgi:sterol desaturase/sphingolipid hydroxylase (fatty acid hydroxylase superfamily)